ncbi:hypothetical protein GGR32_000494 [Mesonia hippocampi]|uniref:Outer membrane protein beta-barrel domain-containing protein n=1 Tax=Mesonia hippocampi TaxID=1628250 RepID=A0A840EML2_9FLAO|nr:porin family protein [Mesonia hippocampi]MBB4118220.1 hypothetical protein [Mesonia hippocampi]
MYTLIKNIEKLNHILRLKKNNLILLFMFLSLSFSYAQEQDSVIKQPDNKKFKLFENSVDSLYREDQFYFGIMFDLLSKKPKGMRQSGFSGGMQLGYIRDMPINKRRNLAFGAGLGWAINSYGQNLFISEDENNKSVFLVLDKTLVDYSTNRLVTHQLEVPLQFRWRTSTPENANFWRIYSGLRLGYIYYFKSKFKQSGNNVFQTDAKELNRFRYSLELSVGNSGFNFYFLYSLNPLFDSAYVKDTNEAIEIYPIKIGFVIYIL